jgi:hypothetical protein
MYNLIVYGSLLHKDELAKHGISLESIELVKVQGFKRIFNQEPSWRSAESEYRAVLNVEKNPNHWFNAIVIKDLTQEYIDDLDIRERGYDRVSIKDGDVVSYDGKVIKECIVYCGKEGKQNDKIYPNVDYYELCLNGANSHLVNFFADYVKTTYQNEGGKIVDLKSVLGL